MCLQSCFPFPIHVLNIDQPIKRIDGRVSQNNINESLCFGCNGWGLIICLKNPAWHFEASLAGKQINRPWRTIRSAQNVHDESCTVIVLANGAGKTDETFPNALLWEAGTQGLFSFSCRDIRLHQTMSVHGNWYVSICFPFPMFISEQEWFSMNIQGRGQTEKLKFEIWT